VPRPCHIVRSTTVNDGSPQSRCAVDLGSRYSRSDLGSPASDHVRPYKAEVGPPGWCDQTGFPRVAVGQDGVFLGMARSCSA